MNLRTSYVFYKQAVFINSSAVVYVAVSMLEVYRQAPHFIKDLYMSNSMQLSQHIIRAPNLQQTHKLTCKVKRRQGSVDAAVKLWVCCCWALERLN